MIRLNLTHEKELEICKSYTLGNSSYKIAKDTGISATQIRRILAKHQIKMHKNKISDIIEREIVSEYDKGKSSELIAKEKNVHSTTVCRILKRNDVKIRPSFINKRKRPYRY